MKMSMLTLMEIGRMTIKTLKNFASMNQSFKDWLTTCPEEYIWQIIEVTEDLEGTFTFRRQRNEYL